MATFHFDLVSPERMVFSGEVEHVVVPGSEGEFGVLAHHAPFLSMLGKIAATWSAYPIHLGYGVTNDFDLVGVERLEDFAVKIPGFTFFTSVAADMVALYKNTDGSLA